VPRYVCICGVCIQVWGTCTCTHVKRARARVCVAHDTRNGWSSTTDARAIHGVGLGLGAREWLWRAERWLMHATTIAPQHAAALHTCTPLPPPSWRRSDERRRFARTGAETFSESGCDSRCLMRTSRAAPFFFFSLSLSLSLSLSFLSLSLCPFYNHRLRRNCSNDTLTTGVFPDSALFSATGLFAFIANRFLTTSQNWQRYRSFSHSAVQWDSIHFLSYHYSR